MQEKINIEETMKFDHFCVKPPLSSDPIAIFDIVLPTLKSSVGIDRMHWKQAHTERWCTSPLVNVKPTVEMLTEDYIHIKNIFDKPWNPMKSQEPRGSSHPCYITFDRSYVVWWYGQKLQELLDNDTQLIFDIAIECLGQDFQNVFWGEPKKLELDDLKALAKDLGYRIHKIEPKKSKKEVVLPTFQIT